ncbi:hypothetical protein QR680_016551 [Steinernema hermaphroditum]|uniref:Uncharacterized protein n=1 Tax=Steinernema hermaphroditum TaxID=289476 RepID=A0AA39LMU4_9BILA|nr:hypothetical protein QR680_016551 [Steinernema hermaphroditum]
MQPIRALLLLLVFFVGLLAAAPLDLQWREMYPSRRAQLLMKRREEKALRNCFFSPVQCLLPITDKTLRKFVPQN